MTKKITPETPFDELPYMLKISEIAAYLRYARQTVYQHVKDGDLKTYGSPMRVYREDLKEFMENVNKQPDTASK
jgi:excisionase family DNA binding protein